MKYETLKSLAKAIEAGHERSPVCYVDKEVITVYDRTASDDGPEPTVIYERDEGDFMLEALRMIGVKAEHV